MVTRARDSATRVRRPGSGGRRAVWATRGALVVAAGLLATIGVGAPAGAAGPATVVRTANNKTWGKILVLGNGDTVYRLTSDRHDKSVCTGLCATIWPPVTLAKGQRSPVGRGVKGLGAITRPGGARQVTFDGDPLYRFSGDRTPGQTNGNLKDTWGQWWVVDPSRPHSPPVRARTVARHSSTKGRSTTTTTHSSGGGYGGGYNY